MPTLSRWFIKTALIYLVLGMTLGGMILIEKAGLIPPHHWKTLPIHIEWLFLGWILQLSLGVSYWIMPRFLTPKTLLPNRGWNSLAWFSYSFLNMGLILLSMVQTAQILRWGNVPNVLILLAPGLILAGVLAYIVHLWPRLMPVLIPPNK